MSGYVNPVFRPDFTDYPAPPQNRLASGFNAIWPASNPVGTETTQGMQSATPTDQIAFMRPDGTPVMQSDMARAHEQVQTAMQVAPTMVLGMMGTTAPGIRAFHGSPYDFERFDTSKIGTGEGAQAYGHGLYFAEKEGTARSYRDDLSQNLNQTESAAYRDASARKAAADAAMTELHWKMVEDSKALGAKPDNPGWGDYGVKPLPEVLTRYQDQWDALAKQSTGAHNEMQEIVTGPRPKGSMYEVNIGADPEQFLHWDKPLSEQHPDVQKAIGYQPRPSYEAQAALLARLHDQGVPPEQIANHPDYKAMEARLDRSNVLENGAPVTPETPGSAIYHAFGKGDPASAAQALQAAGIPGIRYLDQGSRGAGEGTHNYVVFDANTIDILRKYGLAGLGIGLGGEAAGTQQQSQ